MKIVRSTSKKPDKNKFDARIYNNYTVSFGQEGASYYVKHTDKKRK